jgi:hypothetical protein
VKEETDSNEKDLSKAQHHRTRLASICHEVRVQRPVALVAELGGQGLHSPQPCLLQHSRSDRFGAVSLALTAITWTERNFSTVGYSSLNLRLT